MKDISVWTKVIDRSWSIIKLPKHPKNSHCWVEMAVLSLSLSQVHPADDAAGQEREVVLPCADLRHRGVHAHCVHSHCGPGLSAVRTGLQETAVRFLTSTLQLHSSVYRLLFYHFNIHLAELQFPINGMWGIQGHYWKNITLISHHLLNLFFNISFNPSNCVWVSFYLFRLNIINVKDFLSLASFRSDLHDCSELKPVAFRKLISQPASSNHNIRNIKPWLAELHSITDAAAI